MENKTLIKKNQKLVSELTPGELFYIRNDYAASVFRFKYIKNKTIYAKSLFARVIIPIHVITYGGRVSDLELLCTNFENDVIITSY
jgi:hypothetical protein